MTLKKFQILDYWQDAVYTKLNVHNLRYDPKYKVGQGVRIVTKEPDLGTWAYFDDIRKRRMGMRGIVVDIEALPNNVTPPQYSNYSYKILFPDWSTITFQEEHLKWIS